MSKTAFEESATLTKIKALAPEIAERANEIEATRGLPADLLAKLREAGMFRMAIPKKYGGDALHMLQVSRVLEELSRADASVGWTGMVAVGWNKFASHFPIETLEELFSTSPDVYLRGAIAPKGMLKPVEGGYVANGRWPLASGSFPHKYMIGNCLVVGDDGRPAIRDGRPELRAVMVPAEQATLLDTWNSVGLRGSASHDFVIENVFVPAARTADLFGATSFDSVVHSLPGDLFTAPTHGSVAIGIAQGAIDDFCDLARNKRPAFGGGKRMSEDPHLAYRLGKLAVRLNGLRSQLEESIIQVWDRVHAGKPFSPADRTMAASIASYIQHEATDIVSEIFAMSGATPCYNDSLIQRRWRDVRCVAQHIAASTNQYALLGSAMMGEDITAMLL